MLPSGRCHFSRIPSTQRLDDRCGHCVAIPNRLIVGQALKWRLDDELVHDVALRFRSHEPASRTRRAIEDAVLTSPWVRPDKSPQISRDGAEPDLWHVRAHLLDLRFATRFEGDLLERAEDVLAAQTRPRDFDDWD